MSLGCLSTVGMLKPRNLTIIIIIIDNGMYQITGRQPTTTRGTADIVEIARASGLETSAWIRDEAHFDELIDRRFDDGGPVLPAAKVDDQPGMSKMVRDPALIRNRFMKGLGTGRGGALDA
jgi:thiamine pyrophosphate-dependent acetolactate synthase large subunit-like protein